MAKTIKSCDFNLGIAVKVFEMLNSGKVQKKILGMNTVLVTDVEPKDLVYPEGWYYAKGSFRNKHTSTTGLYEEIKMCKSDSSFWGDYVKYCTLYDD